MVAAWKRIYNDMSQDPILEFVEQQDWLQPIQDKGSALVKEAYQAAGPAGQAVKNAMHGVWMGHPLHSAITDAPVGSWTAAFVLDVLEASGQEQYGPGADTAIAVGLVGAVGSAVSGMTDWSETHGGSQRLGAMHGIINMGAALLYATSYALRKSGKRGLARSLSFAGYGLVGAGAYLGGVLSYRQRIGVDNSVSLDDRLPEEFTTVCVESDLTEDQPKKVSVNGLEVVLVKQGAQIFALGEKCAHLGGPLSEGKVEGGAIICPWHGSRFCIKDGNVVDGPAVHPQPKFDVQVRDGQVLLRASDV